MHTGVSQYMATTLEHATTVDTHFLVGWRCLQRLFMIAALERTARSASTSGLQCITKFSQSLQPLCLLSPTNLVC